MEGSGQVLKFGGMSVGSGERIRRVASFIGHHVREGEGIVPVIVVSALSGVTDQLLRIARFACTGDHKSWQQELEALKRKHVEAADKAVLRREVRQALQHDLQVAFSMLEQDISAVEAGHELKAKQPAKSKSDLTLSMRVDELLLDLHVGQWRMTPWIIAATSEDETVLSWE